MFFYNGGRYHEKPRIATGFTSNLFILFWVLAIFVLSLTLWLTKVPITFKSFTYEDVARLLSVVFLDAIFLEMLVDSKVIADLLESHPEQVAAFRLVDVLQRSG